MHDPKRARRKGRWGSGRRQDGGVGAEPIYLDDWNLQAVLRHHGQEVLCEAGGRSLDHPHRIAFGIEDRYPILGGPRRGDPGSAGRMLKNRSPPFAWLQRMM